MIEVLYQKHHDTFVEDDDAAAALIEARVDQGHSPDDYRAIEPRPVVVRCNGNLVETFDRRDAAAAFVDVQVIARVASPIPRPFLTGTPEETVRAWYTIEGGEEVPTP